MTLRPMANAAVVGAGGNARSHRHPADGLRTIGNHPRGTRGRIIATGRGALTRSLAFIFHRRRCLGLELIVESSGRSLQGSQQLLAAVSLSVRIIDRIPMHLAGYDPRSRRPAMRGVPAVPRGAGVTLPRYRSLLRSYSALAIGPLLVFFNSDPAARGTVFSYRARAAVRNNDWGNRLLQFYCVNRSIFLYSRKICCRSFRHHRHHSSESSFTRFTRTPAAGLVQRQAPQWWTGRLCPYIYKYQSDSI
jgi:hypothetical protein